MEIKRFKIINKKKNEYSNLSVIDRSNERFSSVVIVDTIWSFVRLCFPLDDGKLVVVVKRLGETSLTLLPNKPEKLEHRKEKQINMCFV